MEYSLSQHAQKRIKERSISMTVVDKVLNVPDKRIKLGHCKWIYQKKIEEKGKKYLYRVYLNSCKEPNAIITAYKTSKIEKYDN